MTTKKQYKKLEEYHECGECKKGKTIKVFFCPKCNSKDVKFIFGLRNIFGLIPTMQCSKCKFKAMSFPILEVDKSKLNKVKKKK